MYTFRPPAGARIRRPARNVDAGEPIVWEGRRVKVTDTLALCPELNMFRLAGPNYSEWIVVGSEVLLELA